MYDISFDIESREIIMKNNDFATTDNPSVQNGGIMLYSRCANLQFPMAGIGVEDMIGAGLTKATYELNRWQAMAKNDGATVAKWKAEQLPGGIIAIEPEVSYE
jgi:hypothetical protein